LSLQCYHCWSMRSPAFPDDGDEGGLANVCALSVKASRVCMLSVYHGYTAVVMLEICLSLVRLVQYKQKLSTTIYISQASLLYQPFNSFKRSTGTQPCCGVVLAPRINTLIANGPRGQSEIKERVDGWFISERWCEESSDRDLSDSREAGTRPCCTTSTQRCQLPRIQE